jgi:RHS repeat-associated protein
VVKKRYPASNRNPDQYVHSDWQGTVLAVTLPNGTTLVHNGNVRPSGQDGSGLGPLSWLGSFGYWYEGQLARPLHYVRARWYVDGSPGNAPSAGWLSPDPLGFGGGDWNRYRYVGNRPTVRVGPAGASVSAGSSESARCASLSATAEEVCEAVDRAPGSTRPVPR